MNLVNTNGNPNDIRNGVEIKPEAPSLFTVVNLSQVIYARVCRDSIVVKVVGHDEALKIDKEDLLFNHYYGQFMEHKDSMIAAKYK